MTTITEKVVAITTTIASLMSFTVMTKQNIMTYPSIGWYTRYIAMSLMFISIGYVHACISYSRSKRLRRDYLWTRLIISIILWNIPMAMICNMLMDSVWYFYFIVLGNILLRIHMLKDSTDLLD